MKKRLSNGLNFGIILIIKRNKTMKNFCKKHNLTEAQFYGKENN